MDIKNISVPEIYKQSADFRFFCKWFETSLDKTKYDTENFFDLYDPLRCREDLLWLLADTMGYKYDDRLPTAFNRLVLLYFMSMIYNRGSKDGVTLAAEVNLAQFVIQYRAYGNVDDRGGDIDAQGKKILENRLEDTSIPVNAVVVTPHTEYGYIDVVYFATKVPLDACIEYVRPLGMFLFQHAGVRFDARTKITVDARLTDMRDVGFSAAFGPTQVGHYRREDYARLQKTVEKTKEIEGMPSMKEPTNDTSHTRRDVWYRNSTYEDQALGDGTYGSGAGKTTDAHGNKINPGYRSLYSLQLSNNEEIVKALIDPIFSLGFEPQAVEVSFPDDYLKRPPMEKDWNLRYDRATDEAITEKNADGEYDISVIDPDRSKDIINPRPAVNPIMASMGDAISLNEQNTKYTKTPTDSEDPTSGIKVVDSDNNSTGS